MTGPIATTDDATTSVTVTVLSSTLPSVPEPTVAIGPPTTGLGLDPFELEAQLDVCITARLPVGVGPTEVPPGDLELIVTRCREIDDPLAELAERVEASFGEEVGAENLECIAEAALGLSDVEVQLAIAAADPPTGEPDGGSAAVLAGLFIACGGLPGG